MPCCRCSPVRAGTRTVAKLTTKAFYLEVPDYELPDFRQTFRVSVGVDKSGIFTATLPKEIADMLMSAGIVLRQNQLGNYGYFKAESLAVITQQIEVIVSEYNRKELIESKIVLRYIFQGPAHYAMSPDGDFYPTASSEWCGKGVLEHAAPVGYARTDGGSFDSFGVLVFCRPFLKQMWRYPSGLEKTVYHSLSSNEARGVSPKAFEKDRALEWLDNLLLNRDLRYRHEGVCDIDYTPEVAAFFVGVFKSIFRMIESIRDKVSPEAVQQISKSGAPLLGYVDKDNNKGFCR